MKKLKTIIIDDEPSAIDKLISMLSDNEKINIIGTFTDPFVSIDLIETVDLIFLDIDMPNSTKNGIQFAQQIRTNAQIIITTGMLEYALDGYKLGAIGYLTKPIDKLDLIKTVNTAYKIVFPHILTEPNPTDIITDVISDILEKMISIKVKNDDSGKEMRLLKYSEILFGEAENGFVSLRTNSGSERIIVKETFENFFNRLPEAIFIRTHQSYFVNISYILKINNNVIYLRGCDRVRDIVTISRSYSDAFFKRIDG